MIKTDEELITVYIHSIWDFGEVAGDRYTVIFTEKHTNCEGKTYHTSVGMSNNPTHPQGFYQHSDCIPGRHLGKKIKWLDLPEECRNAIEMQYNIKNKDKK